MVVAAILILLSVTLVSQLTEATNPAESTPKRWFAPMKKEPIAPEPAPLLSEAEPIEAEPDVVNYEAIFKEVAAQYKLDWRVLAEQAYWESRMDRYAVGAYQEAGLMQIYPTTWQEWSQKVGVTDPFDPYSNILVGAAYMAFYGITFSRLAIRKTIGC
jgi:soluble lytic murein transglycosylase-like protein